MRSVRLLEDIGARREGSVVSYDDLSAASLVAEARGRYVDTSAEFDPAEATVDEVLAHLAGADEAEQHRVLGLERAGKARVGVLGA